jgi:hypothetical protein
VKQRKGLNGPPVSFLFLVIDYCLFFWSLEFGHWSLSFILTSSISHVIKPHYDEHSDKQLVVVAEIVGVRP